MLGSVFFNNSLILGPTNTRGISCKSKVFEDFLRIPPYSMRHEIGESLVQWFHAETGTFHLGCKEYAVLPLDWIAILGIKFGGYLIPTDDMSFSVASELLGIPLLLTSDTRGYFGRTTSP